MRTHARRSAEVIVVGAGPTGLAAALALRVRGMAVTLLEANPEGCAKPGSRAIYIHRQSLRLLESSIPGLGAQIADAGLLWTARRTYWRGRQVFEKSSPQYSAPESGQSLPPYSSLAQVETERMLFDACLGAGVEVVWANSVASVESSARGVRLTTSAGDTWSAPYVIAADGPRSRIRGSLGLRMHGSRSANSFVVVDVRCNHCCLPERLFHYEHPAVDGRNVLMAAFAGGFRLDLQLHEQDDPAQFNTPGRVQAWVRAVLPEHNAVELDWVTTYRFVQLVAESFTDEHRRILLAGEAAHLFPPFGARGLNSGIADASAAAAAIAASLGADASSARETVDTYDSHRRAAADHNRVAAVSGLAHMYPPGRLARVKRGFVAGLASAGSRRAGAWLDAAPYGAKLAASRMGTY